MEGGGRGSGWRRTAVEKHAERKKAVWEQDRDGKIGETVD